MNVQLLKDLFEWWLGTLRASLPAAWRGKGVATTRRLILRRNGVEIIAKDAEAEAVDASDGALAGAIRRDPSPPVIALEAGRYVLRTLSPVRLPPSRARAMAAFDLASATPFKPDEVHCLMLRPADEKQPGPMSYAIVKRTVIDPVLAELKAARAQPTGIVLLPADPAQSPSWMVAPADVAQLTGKSSWRRKAWTAACCTLAVAIVATFAHVQWSLASAQAMAEEPLPQLESKAKEVRTELNRRAARIKEVNALRHSLATQRSMTEIWEEVSRVLPDNAYVTDLSVRGSTVTLEGFSPAAASIIEPIESSPMFKGAEFSSAVVKVPGKDGERFQVNLEVLSR